MQKGRPRFWARNKRARELRIIESGEFIKGGWKIRVWGRSIGTKLSERNGKLISTTSEAYRNERSVMPIRKDDIEGERERVTTDEEWVLPCLDEAEQWWGGGTTVGWFWTLCIWVIEFCIQCVELSWVSKESAGWEWQDLGALTTARAREFWICWRRVIWDLGRLWWRIAIIKFGVDDRGGNRGGCFGIKVTTDAAKLTNMIIAGFWDRWDLILESSRCSSKMKPRLRTWEPDDFGKLL